MVYVAKATLAATASEDIPFMIGQNPTEKPMDTAEQAFIRERMEILADVTGVKPHILNEKEFGEKLAEIQSEIEAVRMSLLPKSTAPETALPEEDTSFKGTAISSADGAKILKNIIFTSETSSKVVDDNGVPKVVYHGTPNQSIKKEKKQESIVIQRKSCIFAG